MRLLEAGINVLTTMNIQHLESLNDQDLEHHRNTRSARDHSRLGDAAGSTRW